MSARAEPAEIRLEISPDAAAARPLSDAAKMVLTVTLPDGAPAGLLEARLEAPRAGRIFSTDFPAVEGSSLIEMSLPVSGGKAQWEYAFPIRGRYRLSVRFHDAGGGQAERTFFFTVKESRRRLVYLGLVLVALFSFGFGAGRLFASPASRNRLIGACLVCGLGIPGAGYAAQGDGREVARLEVGPAVVGRPAAIRWRFRRPETGRAVPGRLSLAITHLEKGRRVFALENIPIDGEFAVGFQFTDGSDYRVDARQELQDGSWVERTESISATAVEPRAAAIVPALALFLAAIAMGLICGRWSRGLSARPRGSEFLDR